MKQDRLRARCEERLAELRLPHRFTTGELRDAIAARQGRRIALHPLDKLTRLKAPCGLRLEMPTTDVLLCEKATSRHHQLHILAHELSHVLCDHPGTLELDPTEAGALGFDPTPVRRMTGRTGHSTEDEREAETMATLIRQRAYRGRVQPAVSPGDAAERWDALFAGSPQRRNAVVR